MGYASGSRWPVITRRCWLFSLSFTGIVALFSRHFGMPRCCHTVYAAILSSYVSGYMTGSRFFFSLFQYSGSCFGFATYFFH